MPSKKMSKITDLREIFDEGDLSKTGALVRLNVPKDLLPKVNKYGGWFGRDASPGETGAMFVGDRLAHDDDPSLPPLFWGRTGGFLLRCLARADISYHRCYFTNAHKPAGRTADLVKEVSFVQAEKVVALGAVASIELTRKGIEHVALPHPSHVLRFAYTRRWDYVKYLKEALR
jgi:uracil-DNA glycosylase